MMFSNIDLIIIGNITKNHPYVKDIRRYLAYDILFDFVCFADFTELTGTILLSNFIAVTR